MSKLAKLSLFILAFSFSPGFIVRAQEPNKDIAGAMRYRYIGPVGNRVTSVVGIPAQPNIYYVGAASGGIFKTTDGGVHWEPIFDGQPVSSIGSLAIAPSDSNVIWAGTGEAHIRSHISVGAGIYKSTDAGKTWKLMGLEKTGRIARIVIDPKNPDIVLAAALGHSYGPQQERGVFRTTDGGKNWERVLFVDENTGASEVAMDPTNPRILFAGMWPLEIHTWGRESGGPGSGLYKSTDGGSTWKKLTGHGLPSRTTGKIVVSIANSNPNRVYALIETGDGVPVNGQETDRGKLWRSDDGGENWRLVSYDRNLGGRTHYYFRVVTAPDNENETYFLTGAFSVSLDGAETARQAQGGNSPGGDNHDIWIDPTNGNRMAVANDGGVSISVNRGKTWDRVQLPIAQMYHVTVDNRVPYFVYGNEQDDPSYRGPSNSRSGGFGGSPGQISRSMWQPVGGGESGWATPDPVDNNIIWSSASGSGSVGGIVERFNLTTGQGRNVEVWPDQTIGAVAGDLKYRFVWTMPLTISPHDHNRLYVGSQFIHQTTDGGQSWQVISPDLTTNDKSKQGFSGGLTGDNIGVEYAPVVFAIAESPKEKGLIWAGTNDGLVQLTRDGGKNWTNVTKNIPRLPPWGTISNIEPSRYDAGAAYITVDFHQVNNRDPFVYKTSDYGQTWTAITNGLPRSPVSYAHCVREDPTKRGLLYLGTESGLFVSMDDGEHWQPMQSNLPRVPIYWLVVQEHFNDLVIATYGRGFWILDDLGPLQQMNPGEQQSAVLFTPRSAYRFRNSAVPVSVDYDPTAGQNPAYGATINYYLKSAPSGDVKIRIEDADGQLVRTITGTKLVGINRVAWDLRGEQTKEVRLRTSPAYAPEIRNGNEGWRLAPDGGRMSILMPPGTYTVKLSVGSEPPLTKSLIVKKDPNSEGSEADIASQMTILFELRKDLENAADMVNQIEVIRGQLAAIATLLSESGGPEPAAATGADYAAIRSAADELDKKLIAVEDNLIQRKLTGQGQDTVRWPPKLISKINYLANGIASGDFPPTSQQREVKAMFEEQLTSHRRRLDDVLDKDLQMFNRLLRDRGIGGVILRKQ
jgi:photosystem II stability/assembly factor-like uncharacterized protein